MLLPDLGTRFRRRLNQSIPPTRHCVQASPLRPMLIPPAAMPSTTTSPPSQPATRSTTQIFEFTKRKRWADLLISELSGTVILVLSPAGKVLYCGAAVSELLGWTEEDLIDVNIVNFLHEEDIHSFIERFNESVSSRREMSTYVRLKPKAGSSSHQIAQWPLFEIRGHPHYVQDQRECTCFFAMARPHPSHNTAMLDSFLELKMENERLRQRLQQLRSTTPTSPTAPLSSFPYDAAPLPFPRPHAPTLSSQPHSHPYFPMSSSRSSIPLDDGFLGQPSVLGHDTLYGEPSDGAELMDIDEGRVTKKRTKRTHTGSGEQYVCVTCGRTDSPEWRKGPLGPKTLCNACGLRWAKKNAKRNNTTAPASVGTNQNEIDSGGASHS